MSEIERAIVDAADARRGVALAGAREAVSVGSFRLVDRLEELGLLETSGTNATARRWSVALLLALAAFGAVKMTLDILGDRPVVFLAILVAATLLAAAGFAIPPRLTRSGRRVLRALRRRSQEHEPAIGSPTHAEPGRGTPTLAPNVAVLGLFALEGTYLDHAIPRLQSPSADESRPKDRDRSNGCDSGHGGAEDGGGGDGDGGCGGCSD